MMGMGGLGLGIGSPLHRLCRGDAGEMAGHMLVRIEHKIKPTDAQKGAFENFKTATHSAAEKIEASCPAETADATKPEDSAPAPPDDPVERLAQTQAGLEARSRRSRPCGPRRKVLRQYLSDAQKAKFNRASLARQAWRQQAWTVRRRARRHVLRPSLRKTSLRERCGSTRRFSCAPVLTIQAHMCGALP